MIISELGYQRIEGKIAEIQAKVDHGLAFNDDTGKVALSELRGIRVELFKLRSLMREHICIMPTDPKDPEAA